MRLPEIKKMLSEDGPIEMRKGDEFAAVAIILKDNKLVIEKRSTNSRDPWSGQFSLPGGHYSPSDVDLRETAVRETLEETGINLNAEGMYIGHFGPYSPLNRPNLRVYAFIFEMSHVRELVSSSETEYLEWIDIPDLEKMREERGTSYRTRNGIIWGLTARIIEKFTELLEKTEQ